MRITWAAALSLGLLAPNWAAAAKYTGTEAERAARKDRQVVREMEVQLDGRGPQENALVERVGDRLVVRILRFEGDEDEGRFVEVLEGTPGRAKSVSRFEVRQMVGDRHPELVVVLDDPSPDETASSVRVIGHTDSGIRELFAETFLVPPSVEKNGRTVTLGDARPHFVFANVRGDAQEEVVWISGPQTLVLPGRDDDITYVIGAYRSVYAYQAGKAAFEKVAEREVVEFAGPKTVSAAKASAQVPKIWGTAQPFWGADGDLETSWNVPGKEAVGQSLTLKLKSSPKVRLIRVVPGCGASDAEWSRHHRVERFRVTLGSGQRFDVDRADLSELPRGVQAMAEFPLQEGFGGQILIALKQSTALPWARFKILEVEHSERPRRERVNEVCVSEISFH